MQQNQEPVAGKPALSLDQILSWADAYHARTGRWPQAECGPVPETARDTWHKLDKALRLGLRGLPPGGSLARLLAAKRGVRNVGAVLPLDEDMILGWADAHFRRTGCWPNIRSGNVQAAPGENWRNINQKLHAGGRGLRGGDSLAKLLARRRGAPDRRGRPRSWKTTGKDGGKNKNAA